jgi:hypothetical protein
MFLVFIYILLFSLCVYYSTPLFVNEYDTYDDINEQKLHEFLINITKDDTYCFDCVAYHIGGETLNSFVKKQSIERKRNLDLESARTIFNIISIVTSLMTFLIFGAPKLVSFISLCSLSCIFISIYVEHIFYVIIFEILVVFLSLIILLKCCYIIYYAIFVIETKKNH